MGGFLSAFVQLFGFHLIDTHVRFSTDSQNPLIIGGNPIIYSQFIPDTPITHIWMQPMYFPDNIDLSVHSDLIVTFGMFQPSVIGRTSNSKVSAHCFDGYPFDLDSS